MQRVAVDVMGGDKAPAAVLSGAIEAVRSERIAAERVLLVGDRERIEAGLRELGGDPGFEVRPASQVVTMDESASVALRAKPDSSIMSGIGAVSAGEAAAFVSMGNTAAVVAASTVRLGTLPGVRRPGIAVTLELGSHPVTLLDMGANIAPKPEHLAQYGVMGSALLQNVLGIAEPRVALLNIGGESSKGTGLLKEAHGLLEASPLRFAGNVEANEIFEGHVDVVVTDGFTGNVVLKLLEGFAGFMMQLMLRELQSHGVAWGPDVLQQLRKKIDYAEYGGALLLGVAGIVVIGHGRSDAPAVANAIALAGRALDKEVNADIIRGVAL